MTDARRARFLATQISALAGLYVFPALMNKPLPQAQIQSIFREVFTRHLDKLEIVAAREKQEANFDPDESRNDDRVMGRLSRLLEMHGPTISGIDERMVELMRGNGTRDKQIDEVAVKLRLLTKRSNKLGESRERLQELVREAGGEPSPMNLALAQDDIFRARAGACVSVYRR